MKKVIRLTESDLMRIVKRVIKENEFEKDEFNMDMGIDCDGIIEGMDYVYNDIMRYYNKKSSSDTQNSKLDVKEMYDDLESELSGFVDEAYQNDCGNYVEVELMYYDLLDMFVKETGIGNMTESIKRKTRKSPRR